MKNLLLVAVGILTLAAATSIILSVSFSAGLEQVWAAQADNPAGGHVVAVLLPAERDPFWDDLAAAFRREGIGARVSFEFTRYPLANAREVVEKAVLSQVDAVVCWAPEGVDLTEIINPAEARGLPVFLVENDSPNSRRRAFFGVSTFQMGLQVGQLVRSLRPAVHRVGVLLSQTALDRQTVRSSLFLNGLIEGAGTSRVLLDEAISPPGRFAGEELVWNLLRKDPLPEVLITASPKDTSSALQAVVEANRVGKTRLIGVGEDPSLRLALSQGLLTGLLVRDSESWAHTITESLASLFRGSPLSSYVNLPSRLLTAEGARAP